MYKQPRFNLSVWATIMFFYGSSCALPEPDYVIVTLRTSADNSDLYMGSPYVDQAVIGPRPLPRRGPVVSHSAGVKLVSRTRFGQLSRSRTRKSVRFEVVPFGQGLIKIRVRLGVRLWTSLVGLLWEVRI